MSGHYHHGDLPRQLLAHAATMAADVGPEAISLRELARRTGVSHSAPVHHFGTRRGLLTALATEGFADLDDALSAHPDDIHAMGVAYVLWALDHPGHYAVMWQPRLLDDADAELTAVRDRAWALLSSAVTSGDDADVADTDVVADTDEPGDTPSDASRTRIDAYAAFAVVHGLASLWLNDALPRPEDPTRLIRSVTGRFALARRPTPRDPRNGPIVRSAPGRTGAPG